jgi:hypothetical protein
VQDMRPGLTAAPWSPRSVTNPSWLIKEQELPNRKRVGAKLRTLAQAMHFAIETHLAPYQSEGALKVGYDETYLAKLMSALGITLVDGPLTPVHAPPR